MKDENNGVINDRIRWT